MYQDRAIVRSILYGLGLRFPCNDRTDEVNKLHLARSGLLAVSRKKNFSKSHVINPVLSKIIVSK